MNTVNFKVKEHGIKVTMFVENFKGLIKFLPCLMPATQTSKPINTESLINTFL